MAEKKEKKPKPNMMEIAADIMVLFDKVEANGGVFTEELDMEAQKLVSQFESKALGYVLVLNEKKRIAAANKELADHYSKKAKATEKAMDSLKERLCWAMTGAAIPKVETDHGNLILLKAPTLVCEKTDGLPEKFIRKPEPAVDAPMKKEMMESFRDYMKLQTPVSPDGEYDDDELKGHFSKWKAANGVAEPAVRLDPNPYVRIT